MPVQERIVESGSLRTMPVADLVCVTTCFALTGKWVQAGRPDSRQRGEHLEATQVAETDSFRPLASQYIKVRGET